MTQEQIIEMARQDGISAVVGTGRAKWGSLTRFANLVRNAALEEAAGITPQEVAMMHFKIDALTSRLESVVEIMRKVSLPLGDQLEMERAEDINRALKGTEK